MNTHGSREIPSHDVLLKTSPDEPFYPGDLVMHAGTGIPCIVLGARHPFVKFDEGHPRMTYIMFWARPAAMSMRQIDDVWQYSNSMFYLLARSGA